MVATSSTHQHDNNGGEIFGTVMVIISCLAYTIWLIIQTKMSKSFASPYTSSTIMCSMSSIECLIVTVGIERDKSTWMLGWDIKLCAVIGNGLIGSGFAVSVISWCIEKRGPLFVSMFNPLSLIIVAVVGWAILDEKLYLGTVMGSVLIVGGLYVVLCGKGKELKKLPSVSEDKATKGNEEEGRSIELPIYFRPTHETQNDKGSTVIERSCV